MDSVFIISPIVGSIIGYCTNWLAIKMLFRPLTKKKIFGIEIPFTPGVIPRRREELAESIGNTVGKRLLTSDAFEKILQGPVMKKKIKEFIRDKIKNLESEDRSLEEILNQVFKDNQQTKKMKKLIKRMINKNIKNYLDSENLAKLIKEKLNSEKTINKVENYFDSKTYIDVKEEIIDLVKSQSTKEYLTKELASYLNEELANVDNEKKIRELIPEQLMTTIKSWARDQKPEIMKQLVGFIDSDDLKDQIENKVEKFFNNNPMLSMLSGFKDKIVDKFLNYLISFVEEEKNQEKIMDKLEQVIDSILDTKVITVANKLDEEKLDIISEKIIAKALKTDNIKKVINLGEEKLVNKLRTEQGQDSFKLIISKIIKSQLVINIINNVVSFKIDQLFNTPLANYFKELSSDLVKQLETGIVNVIEYIMEHHLGAVFASLDFKNLVKKKIDSFNVLEVERLLLDVIETELNAITWFGAVLGFLLGLITPVISLL